MGGCIANPAARQNIEMPLVVNFSALHEQVEVCV